MKKITGLILMVVFQTIIAAPVDDFVITIKSDNPGGLTTEFLVPTFGIAYNYNIDCDDDGNNEATAQTGDYICDYTSKAMWFLMRVTASFVVMMPKLPEPA